MKLKPDDVKIGTQKEALWTKVKKECEQLIQSHEHSLIIQRAMLKLAEQEIKAEIESIK